MPKFRIFLCDERGNIAITSAFLISLLILVAGVSIDYARGVWAKQEIQMATDTAALAYAVSTANDDSTAFVNRVLRINSRFPLDIVSLEQSTLPPVFKTRLKTKYRMPTTMMRIFGHDHMDVTADAEVSRRVQKVHVAMALDNSGSMTGTRMPDLVSAATTLVTEVRATNKDSKFALVPFGAYVNVGTQYKSASWLNDAAPSPHLKATQLANGTMSSTRRFDLFAALNQPWAGCVEARKPGLDSTDEPPLSGDTLFVPLFVPDDPGPAPVADIKNTGTSPGHYGNPYLDDTGNCKTAPAAETDKQDSTCKYYGNTVKSVDTWVSAGLASGPNQGCVIQPITRLTDNVATIKAAIAAMKVEGGTNSAEGAAWGLRVLSSKAPFADGMTSTDIANGGLRVLVIMTDGGNWQQATNNMNGSNYSAYGYKADNRIPWPNKNYPSNIGIPAINDRLLATCAFAETSGIVVYAVGLALTEAAAKTVLTQCASSPDKAFLADDGAALKAAFAGIATSISAPFVSN
ncbi:MAG: TadE/TadG family protein [Hyphomicrobiaceae bacterium]|nr:TadE/TadG family protein [Hyphomicrobiaceae bacterium]